MNRWEQKRKQKKRRRGAAYLRYSAQGRQENSIENQQDEIYAWAERSGVEIVVEFEDAGISGVTADRPGFQALLAYVQQSNKGREKDLDYVVCYDVSRWGRFQRTDESGYYETLCEQNGVEVVFVEDGDLEIHEGDDDEDESVRELMREFSRPVKRIMAKSHSRQLSIKVLIGTKKVSWQGYRAGGPPPYGTVRMEVDSQGNEIGIMKMSQYKCNPNNRVKLVPAKDGTADVVRDIFDLFVNHNHTEKQIAEILNERHIPAPMGGKWYSEGIRHILKDEQYAGSVVYYKTRHKLGKKKKTIHNPPKMWIRVPGSYKPVIDPAIFEAAQEIFRLRYKRMSREEILEIIRSVFEEYGMFSYALLSELPGMPSKREIIRTFGSLPEAFHSLYPDVTERHT